MTTNPVVRPLTLMRRGQHQRMGLQGYARLMTLMNRHLSRAKLEEAAGIDTNLALRFLRAAHRRGYIRIVRWDMATKTRPEPVYTLGKGHDCAYPTRRPNGGPVRCAAPAPITAPIPSNLRAFFDVLDALDAGDSTCNQVAEETGLCVMAVRSIVAALHAGNLLRVVGWQAGGRGAIYRWGRGKDVPHPGRSEPKPFDNERYRKQVAMRELANGIHSAIAAPRINNASA